MLKHKVGGKVKRSFKEKQIDRFEKSLIETEKNEINVNTPACAPILYKKNK